MATHTHHHPITRHDQHILWAILAVLAMAALAYGAYATYTENNVGYDTTNLTSLVQDQSKIRL